MSNSGNKISIRPQWNLPKLATTATLPVLDKFE